jgi:hypothetical protein
MAFYDTVGLRFDSAVFYDGFVLPQPARLRMAKAKLGMDKLTDEQVVSEATNIHTAMTGNANFPTPNPTMAALLTAINTAQAKLNTYNAAVTATQTALNDRDAAMAALRAALSLLAAYVDNASGGDATKIASSGMGVRNGPGSIGPIGQVLNLVLVAGVEEGTLAASWPPVRGAICYELQACPDPIVPANWTHKLTAGKASAMVNSFSSGTKQWIRARAIGANNQTGPWSDPAVKTVP